MWVSEWVCTDKLDTFTRSKIACPRLYLFCIANRPSLNAHAQAVAPSQCIRTEYIRMERIFFYGLAQLWGRGRRWCSCCCDVSAARDTDGRRTDGVRRCPHNRSVTGDSDATLLLLATRVSESCCAPKRTAFNGAVRQSYPVTEPTNESPQHCARCGRVSQRSLSLSLSLPISQSPDILACCPVSQ